MGEYLRRPGTLRRKLKFFTVEDHQFRKNTHRAFGIDTTGFTFDDCGLHDSAYLRFSETGTMCRIV